MAAIPTIPVTAIQDDPDAPVSVNETLSTRALQEKLAGVDVGGQVQNSLSPGSTTLAPSVDATNAGLSAKANSSHTHVASQISDLGTFSYSQTGLVPAPGGSGTVRFLREDGAWQTVSAGSATWGGITGTLSAQTDLQAALDAKAASGHGHGNFTSGISGYVPASGGGTTNFLRADGTFAAPPGGGGVWGGITGTLSAQADLQAALNAKADLLNAVVEPGTTWTLTKAAHSNRLVIANNAAAITVTFNAAGMDINDGGRIAHGNTGQVTIAGATFGYAPGVSATPNIPAGLRGWLDWRFDGTNIVIEAKSEDATGGGGGGGFVQDQRQSAFVAAAAAAGVEETLATLNFTALTVGQRIHITGLWSAASWANTNTTQVICAVNIGGARVAQVLLFPTGGTVGTAGYTGHRSVDIDVWVTVRALTGAGALVASALGGTQGGDPNLNPPQAAAATTNAAFTATITVQRQGANDLPVGLEHARITIE